jgi:hypothetical protein
VETKDELTSPQHAEVSVEASLSKIIVALLIDILVVLALSVSACSAVYKSIYGASDYAVLICMAAVVLASWVYGFLCFSGHTFGTLVAGTRIIKVKNGAAPGFWGGGWMMFFRTVVICLSPFIFIVALFDSGFDALPSSPIHFSIDKKVSAESAADVAASQ